MWREQVKKNNLFGNESIGSFYSTTCLSTEPGNILHAYDAMYNLDKEIIGELLPTKCPSLVGKPKMIFVQACQGQDTDAGVRVRSRSASGTSTDASNPASGLSEAYTIPNYADLLIYQASYHGHYAFRSMSNGSWFIQV